MIVEKARHIIKDEASKHPLIVDNRSKIDIKNNVPLVVVRVINLGESSIDLKAFIWVKNQIDAAILASDLLESIKNRFDKEDIETPYPHRKLVLAKEAT